MRKLFFTLLFCLIAFNAFGAAQTYYVTPTGNASDPDCSGGGAPNCAGAWDVSDFNSSANWSSSEDANKIDPGDTVYFSGTITTMIHPPTESNGDTPVYSGVPGSYITLDGWAGGTCDPVANLGCASAAEVVVPTGYSIRLEGNSYFIIQDFNIHGGDQGFQVAGPQYGSRATHLTIRRNYIHNMKNKAGQFTAYPGGSYNGTNYLTFGGADGDGNYIYSCLEDCVGSYPTVDCEVGYSHDVGFGSGDDLIVTYNYITRPSEDQELRGGSNGIAIHYGDRALVELNTIEYPQGQSGIAIKETGGSYKVIRFNKIIGAGDTSGVDFVANGYPNSNVYAQGNFIASSAAGLRVFKMADHVYMWGNVITVTDVEPGSNDARGIYTLGRAGDYIYGVFISNNTISRSNYDGNGDSYNDTGIYIHRYYSNLEARVDNNILWYNSYGEANDHQLSVVPGGESSLTYLRNNTLWPDTSTMYYDSGYRDYVYMNAQETGYSNNEEADPNFTDPDGADATYGTYDDDYRLQAGSPASVRSGGVDISQCFSVTVQGVAVPNLCTYYLLDPNNTDWTTNPPTVGVLDARDYSWPRGAYVYTPTGSSAPQNTNISTSPIICPNGQDGNIQISFVVQTDINAYGRISTSNESWDTMGAGKAMTSGEGTKIHTETLTGLSCDQTVTRYIATSTQSDNNGYESSTLQIDIVINAEEPANPPDIGAPSRVYISESPTGSGARVYIKDDTSGNARIVGVH